MILVLQLCEKTSIVLKATAFKVCRGEMIRYMIFALKYFRKKRIGKARVLFRILMRCFY